MAYVPPHKRRLKEGEGSSQSPPKPELFPPLFDKNLKPFKSSGSSTTTSTAQQQEFVYAFDNIFKWFAVGLDDRNQFPPSVHLQTVSVESIDWKIVKRLALFNTDLPQEGSSRVITESFTRIPWEYIAENVLQDLLSSFEDLRSEIIESQNRVKIKPIIIARFGKVLFRWRPSVNNKESVTTNLLSEDSMRPLRSSFYTSIPDSYVEYITKEVASNGGLEFEEEKEVYLVFLSDSSQSDESIFCKCRVLKEHGKLQMHKITRPYVRHMRRDVSCCEKNMDLRLDLCTKRTLSTDLSDDDMKSITDLIDSAIVDTQVKGGLRWPLGKAVSGDKFSVSAVRHIISKTYTNSSLKLKIKDVDRYRFQSSVEQAAREVVIMLKGLASELLKQHIDMNLINEMLKDDLKVIWNNFLCCDERFPT